MKNQLCLFLGLCLVPLCVSCMDASQLHRGLMAGSDLMKAASLDDNDLRSLSLRARQQDDAKHQVASAGSAYATRLERITERLKSVNGVPLNYKVYMTREVNANAMPDGSVRVYSGLMDAMGDDELRFVIGHEIGHVALGHSKKQMRLAYATSAARHAAGALGGTVGAISDSLAGDIGKRFVESQFSQSQESDADAYSMKFLKDNGYNAQAAGSALRKLASGRQGGLMDAMFSTHPDPMKRAAKMDAMAMDK